VTNAKTISWRLVCCLLLIQLASRAHAHNGALVIALPTASIDLDGDLSDWPQNARHYPITHPDYGEIPTDPTDLTSSFRVLYSPADTVLYVAVESTDDKLLRGDGSGIYLDLPHSESNIEVSQYYIYEDDNFHIGKGEARSDTEVIRKISGDTIRCEWKFYLNRIAGKPFDFYENRVIDFDVVAIDNDGEGFASWVAWGRGKDKYKRAERRGDLILVAPDTPIDRIEGAISWESGDALQYGRAAIASGLPGYPIIAGSDSLGRFQFELPRGADYQISVKGPGSSTDVGLDTQSPPFDLKAKPVLGKMKQGKPATIRSSGVGLRKGLWHTLSIADGLPAPFVSDISQDPGGGIWLGTQGGAEHYDGTSLEIYATEQGLPDNDVAAVHHRANGEIWMAMREFGVVRMTLDISRRPTITNFGTNDGLDDLRVWAIHEDKRGHLWFATDGGLTEFDGNRFTSYDPTHGSVSLVGDIAEDASGALWLGTWNGPVRFHEGTFSTYYDQLSSKVMTVAVDRHGTVWFGTVDGVYTWTADADKTGLGRIQEFNGLPESAAVEAIIEDRAGNIWFGSGLISKRERAGHGVYRWDGDTLHGITETDGLADNDVIDIFQDDDGRLWFGTASGGILRYDGPNFTIFTKSDGLLSDDVRAVIEDAHGRVWASTGGGVNVIESGRVTTSYSTHEGLASNDVREVVQDSSGQYWFATAKGITRLSADRKTWKTYDETDGAAPWSVLSILDDGSAGIWFGTGERTGTNGSGLVHLKDGTFTVYDNSDGLPSNRVTDILRDRDGTLWITTDVDACSFDGKQFTPLEHEGIQYNPFTRLMQDRQGQIWIVPDVNYWTVLGISTFIPSLPDTPIARYQDFEGELTDNRVRDLIEDDRDIIWLATDSGISRYNGKVLQHLFRSDGLPHQEIRAIHQDRGDHVWMATRGAV